MNKFIGIGNITTDIDLQFLAGTGKAVAKFNIALKREYKNAEGKYDSDFLKVTAFGKTAEYVSNYSGKGKKVAVEGKIKTGSYEKDGKKVYTTEIAADKIEILEWAKNESADYGDNVEPATDNLIPF